MHPAKSVIYFTSASGAGYGLMVWLALLAALGILPPERGFGLAAFGIGFLLIVSGLLSSTLHLGRPERAWRALSQWRTSWLSREGVAAILGFIPLGLFALCWIMLGENRGWVGLIGLAGAAISLLTIFTTSMIYASLRPIPAWHNRWTVAGYLVLGLMNGAVILAFLGHLFGLGGLAMHAVCIALALLAAGLLVKLGYWSRIHNAPPTSTAGSATGLGHLGKVEMTASPHDGDNYLLREMGFRVARKHASKLRTVAVVAGFVLPTVLLLGSLLAPTSIGSVLLAALAWITCQTGVFCERWLFFAEAKHAVTLYYGEQAV